MEKQIQKKHVKISEDLFSRIAQGDNNAFEQLYYLTYKPLFAFLLSLTQNYADAEDLLQETYIKIRGASHLYQKQGNPMAWIMTIGKNLFLMKQRKEQHHQTDNLENYENTKTLAFEHIEKIEDRIFLQQLFQYISEEDRNIVLMHVSAGMKYKEIAKLINKPVGTVLSRYHRTMKTLHKIADSFGKEAQ